VLAQYTFRLASWGERHRIAVIVAIAVWLLFNGALVYSDLAERPFVSLALGFLGAAGIIAISALLAQAGRAAFVRFCGENSLPLYLAFFLPMAAARVLINKSGLIPDAGTEAAIVTAVAVAGALAIHRLAMPTRFRFLFERPAAFRLKSPLHLAPQR
jgi:peptidoglycan/LPS O-acetylase OafA/YrhL